MAEGEDLSFSVPEFPVDVPLTHVPTGVVEVARLVRLTRTLAKTKVDGAWWAGLGVSRTQRRDEGDHHWDWAAEVGKHHNKLYYEFAAVQTQDDAVQGAAVYRLNGRSVLTEDAGAVVVQWLATAPQNRPWLVSTPIYRGAGTALVRWAAYQSYALGFGGRIVLATLPSPRTVTYYEGLGFEATSAEEGGMVIYELDPKRADAFLREGRGTE